MERVSLTYQWSKPDIAPEPSKPVLIKINGYEHIKIGYFFKGNWYFEGGTVDVLGWTEIPEWDV